MAIKRESSIRVYADTSVFGGVFDAEFFAAQSAMFFEMVKSGAYKLVFSPILENELNDAPDKVKQLFLGMRSISEIIEESASIVDLRDAYIQHGILTPRWRADALHVASATVARCRMIVSWNFRYIVNFRKVRLYNAVNRLLGYDEIAIHTPQEVIEDE